VGDGDTPEKSAVQAGVPENASLLLTSWSDWKALGAARTAEGREMFEQMFATGNGSNPVMFGNKPGQFSFLTHDMNPPSLKTALYKPQLGRLPLNARIETA
jgi:hypothetical protein